MHAFYSWTSYLKIVLDSKWFESYCQLIFFSFVLHEYYFFLVFLRKRRAIDFLVVCKYYRLKKWHANRSFEAYFFEKNSIYHHWYMIKKILSCNIILVIILRKIVLRFSILYTVVIKHKSREEKNYWFV